jgi:DNA ligase-1
MHKFVTVTKREKDTSENTFEISLTKSILDNLFKVVDEMNSTTSINEKRKIYKKKMMEQEYAPLAQLVQLVYHPLHRFHVTAKNCRKFDKTESKQKKLKTGSIAAKSYSDTTNSTNVEDSALWKMLMDLSQSVISGDTALASVNKFRKQFPNHEEHVLHIIDKDLKMRFGIAQINKILLEIDPKKPYTGVARFVIPDFQVSLGYPFDDKTEKLLPNPSTPPSGSAKEPAKKKVKTKTTKNEWFVSRKLDGIRCVAIVTYNAPNDVYNITFYSRKGLEFTSLGKIKTALLDSVCRNIDTETRTQGLVLDGELCIVDKDGKEDFQSVMRELQRPDHTIANPKYLIFDCLTLTEFNELTTEPDRNLSVRLEYLKTLLELSKAPQNRLEMVEQHKYTPEIFEEMSKNIQSKTNPEGWEGLILRKDTAYQGKRSKDLLKVKKFHREEYKVHSIDVGKIEIFNDKGVPEEVETMTAVHIKHKSFDVKVGSGFSHAERQKFYKNPDLIIGKIISVQFFEETKDKKGNLSLRFPTYLGLYGKERKL